MLTEASIRLAPSDLQTTFVVVGKVHLHFFLTTLVGFRCPRLGAVRNPEGHNAGARAKAHLQALGYYAEGTGKTATEEDFQRLAMAALAGSSGPDYLLLR
ncbi:hypothetical protein HOU02_gp163 [Caulobacter phage CcrBL9]|uniref:Uncharacterized protein n=1 Tax=Caulobacter phage CcrBL9 TaxID=2283270 RepID=A0A385EFE1_9CAUD|nr:hypothetical protein HOU02_gp022 [Caulobacter phage CcrBL9]YP_009810192.1 hypothetical protein HOU02_gp163 [Caulobacter phage CcrBL9]AXQ69046.1 hypothetical protein CcrBL9_gp022 [Caulobacter phage CcrBL9]AXQ69562.1 hypothetical protein CcrBL9_gp538 [Caulobacter phage CcrBL9]